MKNLNLSLSGKKS